MTEFKTFETAYRSYPFPLLVDFGVALSRLFVRGRTRAPEAEAPRDLPHAG